MSGIRVLVLRSAGANCDLETEHAWRLAGAQAERVHVQRLIDKPGLLDAYQVLTIPGGFSYGDDIAAGAILAARISRHFLDRIREFVGRGNLVLGVCNGFQVLVRTGLLPGAADGNGSATPVCTIAANQPHGFQDRWVRLRAATDKCAFLEKGREYDLPIAHGEGRLVFAGDMHRERIVSEGQGALLYAEPPTGEEVMWAAPANPNGSQADIAGLCDQTGRILGLMPHPERFVTWTQHPRWTSLPPREPGDGLAIFTRAVEHFS